MKTAFDALGTRCAMLFTVLLALAARPGAAAPVVYIAGDSTVMTNGSHVSPQQGWGGRVHDLFTSAISFNNRAVGGRSSKSFIDEGRLAAILTVIKPGDYLFIQFGHNDRRTDVRYYTDPFTTYKTYLAMYIDQSRQYGAIPVLVTPMGLRRYDSTGQFLNDFVDRSTAMKQLAAEKNVPLIDLNAKSIAFYNGIGVAATTDVFLWLQPNLYPNFPNGVSDATHFQEYGAEQLARLVVQGTQENNLAMRSFIGAVTYPAEAGILSGAGTVRERGYGGWQGSGYVNFPVNGGAMTINQVIGKAGGTRTLRVRYANGSAINLFGLLVVNGTTYSIGFNRTGAWSTWTTKDIVVTLRSGTANSISLKSIGGDLANIDSITVL